MEDESPGPKGAILATKQRYRVRFDDQLGNKPEKLTGTTESPE